MFILFKDGTVHETDDISFNHDEAIASYTIKSSNSSRQVNIRSIQRTSDLHPTKEEETTGEFRLRKIQNVLIG